MYVLLFVHCRKKMNDWSKLNGNGIVWIEWMNCLNEWIDIGAISMGGIDADGGWRTIDIMTERNSYVNAISIFTP